MILTEETSLAIRTSVGLVLRSTHADSLLSCWTFRAVFEVVVLGGIKCANIVVSAQATLCAARGTVLIAVHTCTTNRAGQGSDRFVELSCSARNAILLAVVIGERCNSLFAVEATSSAVVAHTNMALVLHVRARFAHRARCSFAHLLGLTSFATFSRRALDALSPTGLRAVLPGITVFAHGIFVSRLCVAVRPCLARNAVAKDSSQ
jgi:hypothetical protein